MTWDELFAAYPRVAEAYASATNSGRPCSCMWCRYALGQALLAEAARQCLADVLDAFRAEASS